MYLSPASKKARLSNVTDENEKLKIKIGRLSAKVTAYQVQLNDEQSKDMTQLVQVISTSDVRKDELEKIYEEEEVDREEKGYLLRSIWENDQTSNSKYYILLSN